MAPQMVIDEPLRIRPGELLAKRGDPPWADIILADGRNIAPLICNSPGQTNDAHIHPDFNEWWVVLQGELVWEIGDYPPIHARTGDIVFCPAGKLHYIKAVGTERTLRLAITRPDSNHDTKGERGPEIEPFPEQKPPNLLHAKLDVIMERFGEPRWSQIMVMDDRNRANLICQAPGQTNNAHWHPDFDEWWAILKGELTWQVGNRPLIHARAGDIVFTPKGFRHLISTVGDETSLRLAVTTPAAVHIFTDEDDSAPPPRG